MIEVKENCVNQHHFTCTCENWTLSEDVTDQSDFQEASTSNIYLQVLAEDLNAR